MIQEHESYGMIGFYRATTNKATSLFGSSIKHNELINLRIRKASYERNLNRDWFRGGKEILELTLSQAQFAELITSMNQGDGVPCTLNHLNGKKLEDCPQESEREKLDDDFKAQMKTISNRMKDLSNRVNELMDKKGALTKPEKDEVKSATFMLNQEVESNLPFMRSSYEESISKSVHEAKSEVDAFILHKQANMQIELNQSKEIE